MEFAAKRLVFKVLFYFPHKMGHKASAFVEPIQTKVKKLFFCAFLI